MLGEPKQLAVWRKPEMEGRGLHRKQFPRRRTVAVHLEYTVSLAVDDGGAMRAKCSIPCNNGPYPKRRSTRNRLKPN